VNGVLLHKFEVALKKVEIVSLANFDPPRVIHKQEDGENHIMKNIICTLQLTSPGS